MSLRRGKEFEPYDPIGIPYSLFPYSPIPFMVLKGKKGKILVMGKKNLTRILFCLFFILIKIFNLNFCLQTKARLRFCFVLEFECGID